MPRPAARCFRLSPLCGGFALLAAASLLAACTDREDRAAPAPLDASLAEPVEAEGARFQAQALESRRQAAAAFGFDVRGAGLLPVRVSIDNRGGGAAIKIIPRQTFLIDAASQAWPLLTSAQALARLDRVGIQAETAVRAPAPETLETLTGFALDLAAGPAFSANTNAGGQPENRARRNLAAKSPRNPAIPPGQVASGVLFFPGQEEAQGARGLRLCYEQDGRAKCLTLPLKASPPLATAQ